MIFTLQRTVYSVQCTVCTVHKCYTTLKNSKHFVINSELTVPKRDCEYLSQNWNKIWDNSQQMDVLSTFTLQKNIVKRTLAE